MPRIDFIYDRDCRNVVAAREMLQRAVEDAVPATHVNEWDRADDATPEWMRRFGSPTILVDGIDVMGSTGDAHASSCRVYRTSDGDLSGVPPIESVIEALRAAV